MVGAHESTHVYVQTSVRLSVEYLVTYREYKSSASYMFMLTWHKNLFMVTMNMEKLSPELSRTTLSPTSK